jgi:hypothetical protein
MIVTGVRHFLMTALSLSIFLFPPLTGAEVLGRQLFSGMERVKQRVAASSLDE